MAVVIANPLLKPTITVPAVLHLPADNGAYVAHKFEVIFRRMKTDERDDINERAGTGKIKQTQMLDEIVVGWGGMLDENGNPVPYTHAERVATNIAWPGTEEAMAVAWYDSVYFTQREAARKNSLAQSGTTTG